MIKKYLIPLTIIICSTLHAQQLTQRYIGPVNTWGRMGFPGIDAVPNKALVVASGWYTNNYKGLIQYIQVKQDGLVFRYFKWDGDAVNKLLAATDGSSYIISGSRVAKIDVSGNINWCNKYRNSEVELNEPFSTSALQNKDTIIIGGVIDGVKGYDITILKINGKTGKILQQYQLLAPEGMQYVKGMKLTSDGGSIILAEQYTDLFEQYPQILLIKLDKNSNFEWAKKIASSTERFYSGGVIQTKDGGFAVCGAYTSPTGVWDNTLLLKFNGAGTLLWNKIIHQPSATLGHTSIFEQTDSSIICGGIFRFAPEDGQRVLIVKYSKTGQVLWSQISNYDDENYTNDPYIVNTGAGTFAAISHSFFPGLGKDMDRLVTGRSDGSLCNYSSLELSATGASLPLQNFSLTVTDITATAAFSTDSIAATGWPHTTELICNGTVSDTNSPGNNHTSNNAFNASVIPNIITGNTFNVIINSKKEGNAILILKTTAGATILSEKFNVPAGISNKNFTIKNPGKGLYYLQVIMYNQQQQLKFYRN